MKQSSWIKIHRRILASDVSQSDELLGLFIRLLTQVNFTTRNFRGFDIHPGSMAFSWRKLPERLYPEPNGRPAQNTLRLRISILMRMSAVEVEIHPSKRFSILSILNWARYQSQTETVSNSATVINTVPRTVTESIPDPEIRMSKKAKNDTINSLDHHFEDWWATYPRKVAKQRARTAYEKAIISLARELNIEKKQAAQKLLSLTKERVGEFSGKEMKFIPHPATWLNDGRFKDELVTAAANALEEYEDL